MKKTTFSIITAMLMSVSLNAGGGMTGGATEVTQLANNAQLASSYSKQIQQYALQLQQYEQQVMQYQNQFLSYKMMLANIGQLPDRQWNEFTNSVNGMRNIMSQTGGMTYTASNYSQQFQSTYPGYEKFVSENINPSEVYLSTSEETRNTVDGALRYMNMSQQDLEDDQTTMRELQSLSQSADGQKAAVQAANEIALHQTAQLKKLHQTMMVQANAQNQAIVAEQTRQDAVKADIENAAPSFNYTSEGQVAGGRGL